MTVLERIMKRRTLTVMGVNSGTSIDGLDLSVVRIRQSGKADHGRLRITPLMRRTVSFPAELRRELFQMATEQTVALERLAALDEAFGEFIGRACRSFSGHCQKRGVTVDCISSHGQTVRHQPVPATIAGTTVRSSLQIGSPERIAAVTNRIVVSGFRQADIALGGEGAPITTEAVSHCLSDARESRLIVNIGGVANFFYLPAGKTSARTLAEDIGPGNLLLDQAVRILFGKPFDRAGALAEAGVIHEQLLQELLAETFFAKRAINKTGVHRDTERKPRSTGREQYDASAIKKILRRSQKLGVKKRSVLTALTELTAMRIYQRLKPLLSADKRLRGIYLTGGGAKNAFLVRRLRSLFGKGESSWQALSVTKLGMNPDSFEATCFAVLGWMCLHGVPAVSSERSRLAPILGRIIQPPQVSKS